MGNCAACLSSEVVHHSNEEQEEEEEKMMVRVLRTTDNELFEFPGPVFVKDLLFGFQGFAVFHSHQQAHISSPFKRKQQQPLHPDTQLTFSHTYYLHPWVNASSVISPLLAIDLNQSFSKPLVTQPLISPLSGNESSHDPLLWQEQAFNEFAQDFTANRNQSNESSLAQERAEDMNIVQREEDNFAQSPIQSPTKEKVVKKVRFAKELVLIPSLNEPVSDKMEAVASECSSTTAHQSFASEKEVRPQIEGQKEDTSALLKEGVVPYIVKKEVNGVVRVKVVISKKQLTELMASRVSGKQAGEALIMEKMLAPLLSPTTAPQVKYTQNTQSWRPSLNHIPEGHPSQELF